MRITIAIAIAIAFAMTLLFILIVRHYQIPSHPNGAPAVFCVGKNIYRYSAADELCKSLGGRLATVEEVKKACPDNPTWGPMGWCYGLQAYTCNKGVIKGGKLPGQLKFGVYCYGLKPKESFAKELGVL